MLTRKPPGLGILPGEFFKKFLLQLDFLMCFRVQYCREFYFDSIRYLPDLKATEVSS